MNPEDGVLSETELEHQTASMTVLRHVGDPDLAPLPRIERVKVSSIERDRAGDLRFWVQTRERLDQFRLTVALDAGDADDLTGSDVERHVVDAPPVLPHLPPRCRRGRAVGC